MTQSKRAAQFEERVKESRPVFAVNKMFYSKVLFSGKVRKIPTIRAL